MRTAETVRGLGLYRSKCCSEELIYDVGDLFWKCPACGSLCDWELEDEVISYEELDVYPLTNHPPGRPAPGKRLA